MWISQIGGADPRDEDSKGKTTVINTMWSFCPVKRSWHTEPPMMTKRKNFGLVACDKHLYAIGGQDKQGRTLASVERFNVSSGCWEECAALTYPRMGIACAKYQEKIWAAGGMSGSKRNPLSNSVECYDIARDQYELIDSFTLLKNLFK